VPNVAQTWPFVNSLMASFLDGGFAPVPKPHAEEFSPELFGKRSSGLISRNTENVNMIGTHPRR